MNYKQDYLLISAADYVSQMEQNYKGMDKAEVKLNILSFIEGYLRCDMYFKRMDMLYFNEVLMNVYEKCITYLNKQGLML